MTDQHIIQKLMFQSLINIYQEMPHAENTATPHNQQEERNKNIYL